MIKKISYFLLFLISIILIVGYFRYNPRLSFKNKVPVSAETVVHANIRAVEYAIVKDYIKAPLSLFERRMSSSKKNDSLFKKRASSKKKRDSLNDSYRSFTDLVVLPRHAFFYTNRFDFKGAIISSFFKIKDRLGLESFLKKENYTCKNYNQIAIFENDSYFLAFNQDSLVFVYKQDNVNSFNLTKKIFENKLFLKEDSELIKKIKKSESQLTLVSEKKDFLQLNVAGGSLNIKGSLSESFDLLLPHKTKQFKDLGIANLSGKLNTGLLSQKISQNQKNSFKKLTTLSVDSIMNKWSGDFTFGLGSFEKKVDTIITYEYDDDFNKIEKRAINKTSIPGFFLEVSKKELVPYLRNKEAVKKVKGKDVLALVPFFKVLVKDSEEKVSFFTSKKEQNIIVSNDKFTFFIDVENYRKQSNGLYAVNNKYFSLIKTVKAKLDEKNNFSFNMELIRTSPNFIVQILKK